MNEVAAGDANIQTAMLDAVCDGLSAAFIVYDRNDRMVFASRQVLSYFPVPAEFLRAGTRLRDLLGAVYDSGVRHAFSYKSGNGASRKKLNREDWIAERIASHWRERFDIVEKHSDDRWIRLLKRRLANGYAICVITDVSEHKRREEQWHNDLERIQLTEEILDTLPIPICVKDRDLTYVAANKAFCKMHRISTAAILGRTVHDILAPDLATRLSAGDCHVLETGTPITTPELIAGDGGEEIETVIRKYRIGMPGRYFLVTALADVSELSAILSLGATTAPDGRREGARGEAIRQRQSHASSDAGKVRAAVASRKALLVTCDPAVEFSALQTFSRLGIEAEAVRSVEEQAAFLDIAAAHGIGIDLVVIDNRMDVRGLDIAAEHDIEIMALDGFQLCTEFAYLLTRHFNLRPAHRSVQVTVAPAGAVKADAESNGAAPASQPEGKVQILVAEDNPVNQIVFSQILEGLGYHYLVAADGLELVRLWEQHQPDVVLMDITLPGINGIEAAHYIRDIEKHGTRRTAIIGVLAQAYDQDRRDCDAAGMDDVILKPISPDILDAAIRNQLPQEGQRTRL